MSTQAEIEMAYHLCQTRASKLNIKEGCGCRRDGKPPCDAISFFDVALEAIRLGAKLPDPRMERGRAAYEAYRIATTSVSYSVPAWDAISPFAHEAWARAAEAARAAP